MEKPREIKTKTSKKTWEVGKSEKDKLKKAKARIAGDAGPKSKKNKFLIWVLLIVVVVVGWWFYNRSLSDIDTDETGLTETASSLKEAVQNRSLLKVKDTVMPKIKILEASGKYGQWPLGEVTLSSDRGNPFVKKR